MGKGLCVTLSVCVCTTQVCVCCLAVQGAAGAAEKSKIQEWPLYEVSRSGLSVTLERACDGATFCKGILRFQAVKSAQIFSGPQGQRLKAGAAEAPRGRRGQAFAKFAAVQVVLLLVPSPLHSAFRQTTRSVHVQHL